MKEDIIIFGAGKNAVNQYEWALLAGYQILFFVDNDSNKWGKTIEGLQICSPSVLKEYECPIVYPDRYQDEIIKQLEKMQYQGYKMCFTLLKKTAVCRAHGDIKLSKIQIGKETSFIFDSYFSGMNWGGVESWTCMVENQLSCLGIKTQILCGVNERFDKFSVHCKHFSGNSELSIVKKMAKEIALFLPCIFITHGSIALYAAQIIKSIFPEYIQIIYVAHGDVEDTYKRIGFWSDRVDRIVCISERIKNKFQGQYRLKQSLLVYRPNPIKIPNLDKREKNPSKTLKIGFAARLRREQKRVDLLPDIIDACIKKNLNVEFNIAGEGECQELIQTFVAAKHIESKVHILGWIPPTEMIDFWREQDIYLNISDFEGMSLAMLEAMACGTVPITTDVSGVSDLIDDGKNGFIISIDNWIESADKIAILDKDRELLKQAGNYNIELIKIKCDIQDYAKWLIETFHF